MSITAPMAAKAAAAGKPAARTGLASQWRDRVEAADWETIRGELDSYGCALIGP
ncbi:MAG: proline hydroxylase, partial [Chloroflexi bacterium]